jgi:small subunit ribosomal protein S6
MNKIYEIALVFNSELETTVANSIERIENIVKKNNGKVLNVDNWGKRKLAYQIKNDSWGIYVFIETSLDANKVIDIEKELRISEELLRYLIVKKESNVKKVAKPAQRENTDKDQSDGKEIVDKKPQKKTKEKEGEVA